MNTYIDQVKIGQYIAAKRKALGLTQVQLAEKLGMSDKSVSKWERGVCLPDVSVYMNLCDALGISLNEFLAGEDLTQGSVEQQSEKTILTITKDGNRRSARFRRIAVLLAASLLVLLCAGGWFLKSEGYFHHNYLLPFDQNSDQYKLAQQLSIPETPYLFTFDINSRFPSARLLIHEYDHGRERDGAASLDTNLLDEVNGKKQTHTRGTLAILRHQQSLSLLVATEDTTTRLDHPLEAEAGSTAEDYSAVAESGDPNGHQLTEGTVYPLCAYYYTNAGEFLSVDPAVAFEDPETYLGGTDYAVIITAEFYADEL